MLFGITTDIRPDYRRLFSCMTAGIRLVVVVNPDSPTGSVLTFEELTALASVRAAINALLLIDEVYYPFGDVTALPLVATHDNVIVARSFSKAFGLAGIRAGYLVADAAVARELGKVKLRHEMSAVSARIAEYMLDHVELMQDYVRSVVASYEPLSAALAEVGCQMMPTSSAAALVGLPDGIEPTRLADDL